MTMPENTHNSLIEEISLVSKLTAEEIDNIKIFFKELIVTRNTIIEEQGKIPEYLYFIVAGFMRLFYYDNNGEERTTYLSAPKGFIASFSSFINQKKAPENIECVTDCKLLKISYADTRKLIEISEGFRNFSVVMFEQSMFSVNLRANDLAMLNAEQRYQKMLEQQPHFIQNIPLQYIASYLGIKPQSLSRIRKQIFK